ncbi:MAG: S8 family serine peptidase, partial [bacterium]
MNFIQTTTPDDPDYGAQYCLPLQKANDAWDIGQGSAGQICAIMDTGTGRQHPDLAAKIVDGGDCSGITGAISNNATGGAGMAWNSRIMGLRIFPTSGHGGASDASIIGAHDFIRVYNEDAAHVEKIVSCNMSFGGGGFGGMSQDAINASTATGTTYAGAQGNAGALTMFFPANYDNVISVVSTDSADHKSGFSNYGPWCDISACGSDIWNTYYDGDPANPAPNIYAFLSGTSMATPQVNGLIGLIKGQFPDLTPAQVTELIKRTADNIDSLNPGLEGLLGAGRINAFAALTADVAPVIEATGALTMDDSQYDSAEGNRDGKINPGETIHLIPELRNLGIRDAVDYAVTITNPSDLFATVLNPDLTASTIPGGGQAFLDQPFVIAVHSDAPDGYDTTFTCEVSDPSGTIGPWTFDIPVHVERDSPAADLVPGTAIDLTGGALSRPRGSVPFFSVDLSGASNYLTIDRLKVSLFGTISPAAITNVRLWLDDGDGLFQGGTTDKELGLTSYWNPSYQSNFDRQGDPSAPLGTPQERGVWHG